MNIAFYTGVSGLMAYQEHMDITAHNISNSNTPGYKSGRSSFTDLMYTEMDLRAGETKKNGHGAKVGAVDVNFTQAGLNMTGRQLDFALVGDGFFALENEDGIKYTRNGAFGISVEGKNGFLTSLSDGSYVLDNRGKRIKLRRDEDTGTFNINNVHERIGVFTFDNPYGLARAEASSFTETETSGRAKDITGTSLYEMRGGSLEFSGTSLTDEMINIIQSQRAYQMSSKVVRSADEMEELINNLR